MGVHDIPITVPFVEHLRNEDGWSRDLQDNYRFKVVRLHLCLHYRRGSRPYLGEYRDHITVESGPGYEGEHSSKVTLEETQHIESLRKAISENQEFKEFLMGLPEKVSSLAPDIKIKLGKNLREVFEAVEKMDMTVRSTIEKEKRFKLTRDPIGPRTLYIVPSYRRRTYDLYCQLIDYLTVEYRYKGLISSMTSMKRFVEPEWVEASRSSRMMSRSWRDGPNVINFSPPYALVSLTDWKLLPDSIAVVAPDRYRNEVHSPFEIKLGRVKNPVRHPLPLEDCPSLYSLAHHAFMSKWSAQLKLRSERFG